MSQDHPVITLARSLAVQDETQITTFSPEALEQIQTAALKAAEDDQIDGLIEGLQGWARQLASGVSSPEVTIPPSPEASSQLQAIAAAADKAWEAAMKRKANKGLRWMEFTTPGRHKQEQYNFIRSQWDSSALHQENLHIMEQIRIQAMAPIPLIKRRVPATIFVQSFLLSR